AVENGPELYEWFSNMFYDNMAYSETVSLEVSRADDQVFSVIMSDDSYMGGAHPYLEYTGFTFDAQTGERLLLSEVVADSGALAGAAYAEMMNDSVLKQVEDALVAAGEASLQEVTRDYLANEMLSFALTNEGMVLLFSDYMLGSYAAGSAQVSVPYRGNEDVFIAEYMESADPSDDVTAHVNNAPGREDRRDLVELCEEAGIDVTQDILQGYLQNTCAGTYYFNGDSSLAHITFEEDGTYTAYYAHGGVESAGTYEWNAAAGSDYEQAGVLTETDGTVFAEIYYYPALDILEIGGKYYLKG
ncbi:MAG: DUF3298 domain-containing protein, partial [Lachnospiraceae bacterium]|nr:DUF3298 domain-containing protein [Lachnospiraceae bacterium]